MRFCFVKIVGSEKSAAWTHSRAGRHRHRRQNRRPRSQRKSAPSQQFRLLKAGAHDSPPYPWLSESLLPDPPTFNHTMYTTFLSLLVACACSRHRSETFDPLSKKMGLLAKHILPAWF